MSSGHGGVSFVGGYTGALTMGLLTNAPADLTS
jgi:hypothetical protein